MASTDPLESNDDCDLSGIRPVYFIGHQPGSYLFLPPTHSTIWRDPNWKSCFSGVHHGMHSGTVSAGYRSAAIVNAADL